MSLESTHSAQFQLCADQELKEEELFYIFFLIEENSFILYESETRDILYILSQVKKGYNKKQLE